MPLLVRFHRGAGLLTHVCILASLILCTACSERTELASVRAEPLSVSDIWPPPAAAPDATQIKSALGTLVYESERKCAAFISRLALNSNQSKVFFDTGTNILSTLGAVLSPVSIAHAISAGAAASSAERSLIDNDVFAQASIANYADAIGVAYGTSMANYLSTLQKSDGANLNYSVEVANIETIHEECALAQAQSEIAKLLKNAQAAPPPGSENVATNSSDTQTLTLTVAGTATARGEVDLLFSATGVQTLPSINVIFQNKDEASTIASALASMMKLRLAPVPSLSVNTSAGTITIESAKTAALKLDSSTVTPSQGITVSTKAASPVAVAPAPAVVKGQLPASVPAPTARLLTHPIIPGNALQ